MANEDKKNFNAMLHDSKDMPRVQHVTDPATIQKYGGERMYFAPPLAYDALMRRVPRGRLTTVGALRAHLARQAGADFTEPITAGVFVSIAAWASSQRQTDETPWWRTLKAGGELNPKYPGGAGAQKALLEAEGHTVLQKGRKNIRYVVQNYEQALFDFAAPGEEAPMPELDAATLQFFAPHPGALALYEAFLQQLDAAVPAYSVRVQKSQITFSNRHVFACVSFARVRRKAELPPVYFVLTLGLPAPLDSPRAAVKTEPYPGRWTHHIVVASPAGLDAELMGWVREAYAFAAAK